MHLTVGIATKGRREIVSHLVALLANQTRLPDEVVICPASDDDADPDIGAGLPFAVRTVHGPVGSCSQRNAILDAIPHTDFAIFFDDDYIPGQRFIEECEALFLRAPQIAMITGTVVADGVNTRGFTVQQAMDIVAADTPPAEESVDDTYGVYGCNMAMRMSVVQAHGVRFDEALPLYGWLEDLEFSRRVAPYGRIVRTNLCRGVHMGDKKGRTSGVRFGYSQIANPIYMVRKGTMTRKYAYETMGRNIAANLTRSIWPEPWVDRIGRLKGNLLGVRDVLTGQISPGNTLNLH